MKELFLTTITKPPKVIVNKFFCVCFFLLVFHTVKGLPRYYLNDLNTRLQELEQKMHERKIQMKREQAEFEAIQRAREEEERERARLAKMERKTKTKAGAYHFRFRLKTRT
jgi:hypothetical protein